MYTNGKIGSYVSLSLSANLATAWCQDSCSSSYSSSHYIFGSCHSLWILCSIIFATYMPRKFIFNLTLPIGRIGDPESMDHPKDQPLCLVDWTSRSTHPFLNAPFFSLPPSLFPPFFFVVAPWNLPQNSFGRLARRQSSLVVSKRWENRDQKPTKSWDDEKCHIGSSKCMVNFLRICAPKNRICSCFGLVRCTPCAFCSFRRVFCFIVEEKLPESVVVKQLVAVVAAVIVGTADRPFWWPFLTVLGLRRNKKGRQSCQPAQTARSR